MNDTLASTDASQATSSHGLQDQAIDIHQASSLNYWLAALECNELQLRVAIAEVGPAAADVGNALGRRLA
ncbi:MAG: hypothetical protein JWQ72_4045 [Polaromonas sp.]|nr:hypothetical protein [Polaromonas sp.]